MDLNLYMPIKGWKFHWSSIVVLWLGWENTENLAVALSQSTRLERLEVEWRGVSTDLDSVPIDAAQSMITLSSLKKNEASLECSQYVGGADRPSFRAFIRSIRPQQLV